MATNQSRREILKLYRIYTRGINPFFIGPVINAPITGYINRPSEYTEWDDPWSEDEVDSDGFTTTELGFKGPSPSKFLEDLGFSPGVDEFIIQGVYGRYSRTSHNLAELSSYVWIIQHGAGTSANTEVTAVLSTDKTQTRKVIVSSTDASNKNVLEFDVNPNNINIIKRKLFQKIRTRGGWAFQHWGPDIGEITLDGVTRNITPPDAFIGPSITPPEGNDRGPVSHQLPRDITIPDVVNSPVLKAFRLLEQWYDEDQNEDSQRSGILLALEYRGRVYVGHLREFSYGEHGTRPFLLTYKLSFLVHYDSGALGTATATAQSREIRNQSTILQIQSMKGSDNSVSTG